MRHSVDHDALAMIDARNIATAAENYRCLASAVVDHEFDSGHTTARFDSHSLDFARELRAIATLRIGNIDKSVIFESLTESLRVDFKIVGG